MLNPSTKHITALFDEAAFTQPLVVTTAAHVQDDAIIPEVIALLENEGLDLPERSSFPLESFPSTIRDYALDLATTYGVPVELPALCMLGALSGAMGKSWQVANVVSQRVTRANLYIVLSLNSGAGKSIANLVW